MLPYQNYYQQTYPNYQPQNNYMQQMQMQIQANNQGVMGRFVGDFSEIVANDVPMDGRSAIFPKYDMSEIQVRSWGADGKIKTTSYKPISAQNNPDTNNLTYDNQNVKIELSDNVTEVFMQMFNDIVNRLDLLEKSITKPTQIKSSKEIVNDNE